MKLQVTRHIDSAVRKQREMNAVAPPSLYSVPVEDPAQGWCSLHFGLFSSVKQPQTHPDLCLLGDLKSSQADNEVEPLRPKKANNLELPCCLLSPVGCAGFLTELTQPVFSVALDPCGQLGLHLCLASCCVIPFAIRRTPSCPCTIPSTSQKRVMGVLKEPGCPQYNFIRPDTQ